jgi:hypothetical protein
MKQVLTFFLILSFLATPLSYAQDPAAAAPTEGAEEDDVLKSTKMDVLTVAGAGVGGAIIGLSTLSFYEKPSKHLMNIWTGAALGIIGGVIFVAVSHATKTEESLREEEANINFDSLERQRWHNDNSTLTLVQGVDQNIPVWFSRF